MAYAILVWIGSGNYLSILSELKEDQYNGILPHTSEYTPWVMVYLNIFRKRDFFHFLFYFTLQSVQC